MKRCSNSAENKFIDNNCGNILTCINIDPSGRQHFYTMRHIPRSLRHNLANLLPYFLRICKKGRDYAKLSQRKSSKSFSKLWDTVSMLTIFFLLAVLLDIKKPTMRCARSLTPSYFFNKKFHFSDTCIWKQRKYESTPNGKRGITKQNHGNTQILY